VACPHRVTAPSRHLSSGTGRRARPVIQAMTLIKSDTRDRCWSISLPARGHAALQRGRAVGARRSGHLLALGVSDLGHLEALATAPTGPKDQEPRCHRGEIRRRPAAAAPSRCR
jgi:hypothetical protein